MTLDRSKISRRALAKATHTDVAHISRILSGSRVPSASLLHDMARELGTTMDALYSWLYPAGVAKVRKARAVEDEPAPLDNVPSGE